MATISTTAIQQRRKRRVILVDTSADEDSANGAARKKVADAARPVKGTRTKPAVISLSDSEDDDSSIDLEDFLPSGLTTIKRQESTAVISTTAGIVNPYAKRNKATQPKTPVAHNNHPFFAPRKSAGTTSHTKPTTPFLTTPRLFPAARRPQTLLPKVTDRGKVGRFVKYLVEYPSQAPTWKLIKDLTENEQDAKTAFLAREKQKICELKALAGRLSDCASRGDQRGVGRILAVHSYEELELYVSQAINRAEVRESKDIGDWGNVKQEMYFYRDTPLISAVRRGDVNAVHALLATGICDPTLTSTDWECYNGYSVPEKAIWTPLRVAQVQTKDSRVEALVQAALSMWPEATYSSPNANSGYNDKRKEANYSNRMIGVHDSDSQRKKQDELKRKLVSALAV